MGVIALHTAITHGFDGSWYLESYDEMTGVVVRALTVVLGTGWLFGLGLFFLIAALLVFSLVYALWRALRREAEPASREPLSGRQVAAVAVAISVTSFTAHLAFPIGSEQFHLQLGMFPQYVILFSLGAAAGRRGWLDTLTPELQRRCGLAGVTAVLILPVVLAAGGFFSGGAAVQPLPLPAELKFTVVLAVGVAGSFALAGLRWPVARRARAVTLGPVR